MSLGILAVIMTAGILLISVSFLMYGAATGLGEAWTKAWLGWVVTGGFFLLGPTIFLITRSLKSKKVPSDISEMSETLLHKIISATDGLDIRKWTREHPYQATGTAAVAGFIASSKGTSELADILKKALLPLLMELVQFHKK